jgi:vacuolar-type H+-ATPase subunit C/Vma6
MGVTEFNLATLTTERYDWVFPSGRVSALEGKLLSREFLHTLLAQARTEDLLRLLQDTALGASLTPGAVWEDCGALIDRYFLSQVRSLRGDSPAPMPADLFLLQGEYMRLKKASLAHAIADEELPETLRERLRRLESGGLDAALDGAYLEDYLALAEAMDVPLLREYAETYVLSRATVALWRAQRNRAVVKDLREHFLPVGRFTPLLEELLTAGEAASWPSILGGELGGYLAEALEAAPDERIPKFERLAAERLSRIAATGRYQAFGPERVFAYFAALADEAYNLKVIVCGRLNGIGADLLRTRLRDS